MSEPPACQPPPEGYGVPHPQGYGPPQGPGQPQPYPAGYPAPQQPYYPPPQGVREGDTYSSNIGMDVEEQDIATIPPPVKICSQPLNSCDLQRDDELFTFYDLETTGLSFKPEILQIAACRGEKHFNRYILPKDMVSLKVTEVTGLTVKGSAMFHNGVRVPVAPLKEALTDFLNFLNCSSVLVGHNIFSFDNRILVLHLMDVDLLSEFEKKVSGCIDSLPLFKRVFPDLACGYKQQSLVKEILQQNYDGHNALADVVSLQKLFKHSKCEPKQLSVCSLSSQSVVSSVHHKIATRRNKKSLEGLVAEKVLSDSMATKIASSGLQVEHLKLTVKRGGVDAIQSLFTEPCGKHVRVTKSKAIINKVADHLSK